MRVVVTGATGNIGSALLPELAARPEVDEIVGVARRAPKWDLAKVRWHAASIERDDLRPIFAGADAVVHLVWIIQPSRDPEQQRIVNIVGTERMLAAAADSDVRAVIHASSVGAYSPGPRDQAVDEHWPTGGNAVLAYSWQKAYAERLLDRFERDRPSVRVVRLRPALVMQRSAGREVKHYFLGRLLPNPVVQPACCCPSSTAARSAFRPFTLPTSAAPSPSRPSATSRVRSTSPPPGAVGVDRPSVLPAVTGLAAITFHARLQPTAAGWVKAAASLPMMDTRRIRAELGWEAVWSARDAIGDLLSGIHDDSTGPTPALVVRR